jgi:hypothetical protein
MTYRLRFNVYYKGFGFDADAREALRNFINTKYPQLSTFNLFETGSGFLLQEGIRDVGYSMKVHNKPLLAGSLLRQDCSAKRHKIDNTFRFEVSVTDVKP